MSALMTTKEAAHYLALAPYTLHRDRATGRLKVPFVQLGKAIRYQQEALDEWIKEHEVVPQSAEDVLKRADAVLEARRTHRQPLWKKPREAHR